MISKEDTQLLKVIAIMMVIVEHLGQVLHIILDYGSLKENTICRIT